MILPLLISFIMMVVVLVWKLPRIPPQIPLYFSLPLGEDQLGEWWMIFIIPFLMVILIVINNTLVRSAMPRNSFVSSIIKYINIVIVLVLTFVFIRIILLVT